MFKILTFLGRCHIRRGLLRGLSKSELEPPNPMDFHEAPNQSQHYNLPGPLLMVKRKSFPTTVSCSYFLCHPHPSAGFCCSETLGEQPVLLRQVVSKGRTLPGFVHCPKQAAEPGPGC